MSELLQFLLSGVTVGAVYALVALGFTIIYNASDVVNFAQGEFVMLGGMITVFAHAAGLPLPLAALIAVVVTAGVGVALNKLAIEPARGAPVVSLIIITIGASIFLRGVAQLVFDKQMHRFPAFSGDAPIRIARRHDPAAKPVGDRGGAGGVRRAVAVLHPDAAGPCGAGHVATTGWPRNWWASTRTG